MRGRELRANFNVEDDRISAPANPLGQRQAAAPNASCMPMNAASSNTMIDRSKRTAPIVSCGMMPAQQLHGRVRQRKDDLEDHHREALRTPIAAEGTDELDDDPGDEQQPEDEQREAQDLEEQRQLGDLTPSSVTLKYRQAYRRNDKRFAVSLPVSEQTASAYW